MIKKQHQWTTAGKEESSVIVREAPELPSGCGVRSESRPRIKRASVQTNPLRHTPPLASESSQEFGGRRGHGWCWGADGTLFRAAPVSSGRELAELHGGARANIRAGDGRLDDLGSEDAGHSACEGADCGRHDVKRVTVGETGERFRASEGQPQVRQEKSSKQLEEMQAAVEQYAIGGTPLAQKHVGATTGSSNGAPRTARDVGGQGGGEHVVGTPRIHVRSRGELAPLLHPGLHASAGGFAEA